MMLQIGSALGRMHLKSITSAKANVISGKITAAAISLSRFRAFQTGPQPGSFYL
jgi:hypothetical protein